MNMGSMWEWIGWGVLVAVVTWLATACARAVEWVWLRPKRLERCLREQGLKGTPYKFLHGDLKEDMELRRATKEKPMSLSHDIVPRVTPFHHQTMDRYGKIHFSWFGPYPRVSIMDPELVREILSNKFGHFEKPKRNPLARLVIQGLVAYEGEKWAKHRRTINPAFHLEKLKHMLPAFSTSCHAMVLRWVKLVDVKESVELDVWPEIQKFTGDVISRTAFGSCYEEGNRIFQLQAEQAKLFMQAFQNLYIPGYRFLPTKHNKKMRHIYREVRMILRGMIEKREEAMKLGEPTSNDLLGILLESNSRQSQNSKSSYIGMTIDDVIEECKLFYFAGQETTATLLTFTMIVLSMHPNWQARAREEVLQIFGKNIPDFDGLSHLKIVTMILYEVLRLYTPAILLNRSTYKEIKVGDITFPPGVDLLLPLLSIHHDKELWGEDVNEFKPERFAEGVSKASKSQVAFFPFGGGPRVCIGQNFAMMEAKIAMAMILQRLSFHLSPSYIHAPCTVLTLQPQHGAPIILHKL